MQLSDWLAHQEAQHPKTIELGLERVREVALRLALLPWRIPSVIVGGTNGKGSNVAFLTALARAANLRVGTYTSPHLQHYNERVAINGDPVDDAALIRAFERIEAARGSTSLTFFEYGTLAALLVFAEAGLDAVVIEVGLGGRLDATNIIDADVAVLCSVGLDHQDWLGPTVEDIGREKAGIFRAGRPVILGARQMPNSVHEAISAKGCVASQFDLDFHIEADHGNLWSWRGKLGGEAALEQRYENLARPALAGPIQKQNAAVAIAAFSEWLRVRPELAPKEIAPKEIAPKSTALETLLINTALTRARLRGRFERIAPRVADDPEWILDVAHNADSASVLAQSLAAEPCTGRTFGVVGILGDKDATVIGEQLAAHIDAWVLCGLPGPRGGSAEDLRRRLPAACRSVALAPDVPHGCATARALANPQDRIVVFGSFHVVGPALDWLRL